MDDDELVRRARRHVGRTENALEAAMAEILWLRQADAAAHPELAGDIANLREKLHVMLTLLERQGREEQRP
jgi:hypothetical protein